MLRAIYALNRGFIQIIDNQLFLCLIFQRARLFLLPTLRLRLDFAIWFSKYGPKSLLQIAFIHLGYMVL
jgi:hypothetical protein